MLGRGDVVMQCFDERLAHERMREGFDVLNGGERVVDGAFAPRVVRGAEVEDDVVDVDLLGGFEGALDFVHGVNAAGFFDVDEVERGSDVAAPLRACFKEWLMDGGAGAVGAKPLGDLFDGGAVGVVEVVPGSEDFDAFGPGAFERVEMAGVKPLMQKHVGGNSPFHRNF